MICEYCNRFNEKTEKIWVEQLEDWFDLCPDCQDEELETCDCGRLATHDSHTYCDDCY